MKTSVSRQPALAHPKTTKTNQGLKRTDRQFSLRQQLVYHDPRQWDKDITTGKGEE